MQATSRIPDSFSLAAPAKLNLFLHITGKRPDGYHELQTLFVLLNHGDRIGFSRSGSLEVKGPEWLQQQDNLVYRAARLLQQHCDCQQGAQITLDKQLPAGGGVGGGSSDAATTLLGLNALWNCQLSTSSLSNLATQLGADVPVFVQGHTAWAEGIGEQLQPLTWPEQAFIVIHPGISVPTAQIFADEQLTRDTPKSTVAHLLEAGPEDGFRNDCEPVAARLYPDISTALDWLKQRTGSARMTGTGSCIFSPVANRQTAEQILAALPPHWTGFFAHSVNRSPALSELATLCSDSQQ